MFAGNVVQATHITLPTYQAGAVQYGCLMCWLLPCLNQPQHSASGHDLLSALFGSGAWLLVYVCVRAAFCAQIKAVFDWHALVVCAC